MDGLTNQKREEPRHQWGQLLVNFPESDHWRAHPEDIEISGMSDAVRPGTLVRVRRTVNRPRECTRCISDQWTDGRTDGRMDGPSR